MTFFYSGIFMAESDQILVPEVAKNDPGSFEILRVWVANNGEHVSLRVGVWEDPASWGFMLADLAGHLVNSYEQDAGLDRVATMRRIKFAFNAKVELSSNGQTD
jgi:Domain of unknown function (DUF5076)